MKCYKYLNRDAIAPPLFFVNRLLFLLVLIMKSSFVLLTEYLSYPMNSSSAFLKKFPFAFLKKLPAVFLTSIAVSLLLSRVLHNAQQTLAVVQGKVKI